MVSTPVPYMNVALLSKHKCPQKTNDPFKYFWHVNEDKQEKDKATIMLFKERDVIGEEQQSFDSRDMGVPRGQIRIWRSFVTCCWLGKDRV